MRDEPRQDVMTILPNRLHHDQRRGGRNFAKDLHASLLRIDEAVLLPGVVLVSTAQLESEAGRRRHKRLLDSILGRPAFLVRG